MREESSVKNKLKEAGKHSAIYGIGSIAQSAASLLLLPILTGALSKSDFGVYSLIIMVGTIASAIFYLGMTSALPRSYYDYSDESDRRAVFATAFVIVLAGSLLQVSVGAVGNRWLSGLLFDTELFGPAIFWALIAYALTSINGLLFCYLRMLRKSISTIFYSFVNLFGSVGLTVLLLKLYPSDLRMPFIAMAVAQFTIVLAFLVTSGRNALSIRVLPAELFKLVPYGVASICASFGGMLLEWMDRLFIENFMTLQDVGDYSAIYRTASLMNVLVIVPFTQIWSPMMMEYRKHANIKELYSRVMSYYILAGACVISVAGLLAQEVLELLIRSGVSQEMVWVFLLVLLAIMFSGLTNIVVAGLFYERKLSRLVYVYYGVAIAKMFISVFLISTIGLLGAALSTLMTFLLLPTAIYAFSRKYFSFYIEWFKILKIIAMAGVIAIGGVILAAGEYDTSFIRALLIIPSLTMLLYIALGALEREKLLNFSAHKIRALSTRET